MKHFWQCFSSSWNSLSFTILNRFHGFSRVSPFLYMKLTNLPFVNVCLRNCFGNQRFEKHFLLLSVANLGSKHDTHVIACRSWRCLAKVLEKTHIIVIFICRHNGCRLQSITTEGSFLRSVHLYVLASNIWNFVSFWNLLAPSLL